MIRKFITYLSFNGLNLLISVISVPIITSYLTPAEYGRLGLALSLMVFIMPIITFSGEGLVQVEKKRLTETNYQLFFNTLKSATIILTIIFLIIGAIAIQLFSLNNIFLIVPFICLFRGLKQLKTSELVILDKPFLFGIINATIAIATLLITVIIFYFIDSTAEYRLFSIILTEGIIMIIILRKTLFNLKINTLYLREILQFGWPLMLATAPGWILNESGRFILLQKYDLNVVGYYTLALQIAFIYLHFNNAIGNSLLVTTYDNIKKSLSLKNIGTMVLFQAISLVIVCLTIYYIGDHYIHENYIRVYEILWYVIAAFFIQSLSLLPSFVLTYYKRTGLRLFSLCCAALTTVFISYSLLNSFGIVAIGIGLICGFTVFTVLMFLFAKNILNKNIKVMDI